MPLEEFSHKIQSRMRSGAISPSEVIQAGDVFLLRIRCPKCDDPILCGFPFDVCLACGLDFSDFYLDGKSRRVRLLLGTKRKRNIPIRTIKAIYETQEGLCAYCFYPVKNRYHVEHIIPLAVGGTNNPYNLCISCPECNRVAGALYFKSQDLKRSYILERRKNIKLMNIG